MGDMSKTFILLMLLFLGTGIYAQSNIGGVITDSSSGAALSGVSIRVKGTGTGTLSSGNGSYSINAKAGDVLEITYVGYNPVEVTVGDAASLNVKLAESLADLGQIVLVGSRGSGRVKTETPAPVDIVNTGQAMMPTARMDVTSLLNYAAPSFNYNKQSGSDGADHIDLATLRGLGPDQTLVLVNGKRRHQTAFVAVFGTRGRGNSGTDLNALPVTAIDRVEILRDGASAQYGSDAIAGVINLILKKDTKHLTGNIGVSSFLDDKYNSYKSRSTHDYPYQGKFDGTALNVGLNYGFPVGTHGGYLNLSGDFLSSGKTFRQEQDGILPINYVRRSNGDGSLTTGGIFLNFEAPAGTGATKIYAFGGYNYKSSDAFAFTRSWAGKPSRFPSKADGSLDFVPDIMYQSSDGDTVYNPHIQTKIGDASLAIGIKGVTGGGWDWDFSKYQTVEKRKAYRMVLTGGSDTAELLFSFYRIPNEKNLTFFGELMSKNDEGKNQTFADKTIVSGLGITSYDSLPWRFFLEDSFDRKEEAVPTQTTRFTSAYIITHDDSLFTEPILNSAGSRNGRFFLEWQTGVFINSSKSNHIAALKFGTPGDLSNPFLAWIRNDMVPSQQHAIASVFALLISAKSK